MTWRSLLFGVALGLLVAGFTYFNDAVIRQTHFVGNHLPIGVFGVVLAVVLLVNPLLAWVKRGWALRPGELALATAVALAACGWPGSGFFRTFTTSLTMPTDLLRNNAAWQAAGVMSYVPDASPLLADGHLRGLTPGDTADGHALGSRLAAEDAPPAARALWSKLTPRERETFTALAMSSRGSAGTTARGPERDAALLALNRVVAQVGWVDALPADALPPDAVAWLERRGAHQARYDALLVEQAAWVQRHGPEALAAPSAELDALRGQTRYLRDDAARTGEVYRAERMANRWALAAALPGHLAPPPAGRGVLPAGGQPDRWVIDGLLVPRPSGAWTPPTRLPWPAWSGTLWRWGVVAAALALATLMLSLIVHPQWSGRELLPYPLVRFLNEASARAAGRRLPDVLTQRLFWLGAGAMLLLHGVNGLGAWSGSPARPIQTTFDFAPFRTLFPNAAAVHSAGDLFTPTVYPIVIAFTFFLALSVGFSLGSATFFWAAVGGVLLAGGQEFTQSFYEARQGNLLRFGAFIGMGVMIAYTGRRYYLGLTAAALWRGLGNDQTPGYAVWAARLLPVFAGLAVWALGELGLAWGWALAFVGVCLGIWLIMARIVCETGCFYVQPGLLPVGLLAALMGPEALGPTGLVLLGMASMIIVNDQREAIMPYLMTGLKLADQPGASRPGRAAWPMAAVLVGALGVAGAMTLWLQYNLGVDATDRWSKQWFPSMPWDHLARQAQEMAAEGTLTEATWASPWDRLGLAAWDTSAWGWLAAGLALVVGCAFARLRVAWWPIHPVLFLVWGTTPSARFAWSFLLGWAIKALVVKLAGAKGYHAVRPLMIGVIAGELFAALGWTVVGVVYYLLTGQTPADYVLLPR